MTLIISITAVSAAENSTTSPVVSTHVESNTQNQLTTVAEKEVVSNNKVETNAISKATKSVKTSEVKSTNNDKVTQTTTKSNNNTIQTSSQTIIQNKSVTKTLKTTNDVKSSIVLKINPITTTAQKKITLNATAYTSNNKPLNNVDAVFKINGVTIGKTKTVKGLASLDYTVPKWGAKNYNLLVKVGETSSTLPQSANTTLKLVKDNVTINMGSYSAAPSSKVVFKANITQSNNIPLNNVTVVFKVNDVTIGKTTVLNGMCNMTYTTPKNPKTYKLTVKVGETNYTLSKTFNTNLNVLKPSKITISSNIIASKKSTVTLTAKVTDLTGNLASSGKVAFKINGKTISTISVVNGIATLKYNTTPLSTALNNITVVYSGNSKLNANTTTSKLRLYNYVFSYNEVLKKAYDVKVYIEKYNALPKTVMFGSVGVSQVDFLYMVSRVLSTNNSFYAMGYMAKTSSSTSKYGVNIYKNDYASLSKEIAYNFDTYGYSPVNIKVAGYSLSYEDAYYLLTRAVSYLYVNKNLPNYSTVLNIKTANQTSNPSTSNPSTNTVPDGYSQYLVSSKNCEVNSTAIKNALSKAIAGVTGTYNQAVAIFNYVNKHTSYSGYYNTRYGAIGTLNRGYGNCVDTAHLVIAMMRTANIPARYCHATCYFRSGLVTGHVWAEVYVNGKWYKCDGTSNSNTFGNIVNWNSCGSITRYISLPF